MSLSVGWLARKPRIAQCTDTLTVLGDKFVIGEEFPGDPGIGRLLQIRKTDYQKNSSETTLGGAIAPTAPSPMNPPQLATMVTFRSLCAKGPQDVFFLTEQLVRSSEQLVLVDTKRVFRPWVA